MPLPVTQYVALHAKREMLAGRLASAYKALDKAAAPEDKPAAKEVLELRAELLGKVGICKVFRLMNGQGGTSPGEIGLPGGRRLPQAATWASVCSPSCQLKSVSVQPRLPPLTRCPLVPLPLCSWAGRTGSASSGAASSPPSRQPTRCSRRGGSLAARLSKCIPLPRGGLQLPRRRSAAHGARRHNRVAHAHATCNLPAHGLLHQPHARSGLACNLVPLRLSLAVSRRRKSAFQGCGRWVRSDRSNRQRGVGEGEKRRGAGRGLWAGQEAPQGPFLLWEWGRGLVLPWGVRWAWRGRKRTKGVERGAGQIWRAGRGRGCNARHGIKGKGRGRAWLGCAGRAGWANAGTGRPAVVCVGGGGSHARSRWEGGP